jgi:hypothetical protein
MIRYRYRNVVPVGEWFENREDAINDAIENGQARRTESGLLEWIDHGALEEDTGHAQEIVRPAN